MKSGLVDFLHPAIGKLKFYSDKSCSNQINFPLDLAAKALPERIYIRAEGQFDAQVEGELIMTYKTRAGAAESIAGKLRLTIVARIGDDKYFHAARDYMKELNSRVCVKKELVDYVSSKGNSYSAKKTVVMMLHENSKLKTVETFHRSPKQWGIGEVTTANANADVAVNGNFCFANNMTKMPRPGKMTAKCHGILISGGAQSPASSTGGNSPFESAQADYIASSGFGSINISTGIVPISPPAGNEALGGFASKLENYGWHPWYGIGEAGNKKVVFVATPSAVHEQGGAAAFAQKLEDSGVPALPGGVSGEIQCIAGDGGTSLALSYKIESEPLKVRIAGKKHHKPSGIQNFQTGSYYINTYLVFETKKPR